MTYNEIRRRCSELSEFEAYLEVVDVSMLKGTRVGNGGRLRKKIGQEEGAISYLRS